MKGISGEESGLFHIPNKNCEDCANNLGNGVCTGNSKNEMVDTTGELKCFEPKKNK